MYQYLEGSPMDSGTDADSNSRDSQRGSTTADTTALSLGTSFEALGRQDRRRLLHDLHDDGPVAIEESAGVVSDGSGGDVDQLKAELLHVHLPKLEAEGIVTYDREAGEVRRGPNFAEIEPLLDLIAEHGDELPDGWL